MHVNAMPCAQACTHFHIRLIAGEMLQYDLESLPSCFRADDFKGRGNYVSLFFVTVPHLSLLTNVLKSDHRPF